MTKEELIKEKEECVADFKKLNFAGLLDYEYFQNDDEIVFIVIQQNNEEPIAYLYEDEFIKELKANIIETYPTKILGRNLPLKFKEIPLKIDFLNRHGNITIWSHNFIVRLVTQS